MAAPLVLEPGRRKRLETISKVLYPFIILVVFLAGHQFLSPADIRSISGVFYLC